VFAGLPLLAPLLLAWGWYDPALLIYSLYRLTCHQWPGRSYFLFGASLVAPGEAIVWPGLDHAAAFLGNAALGFKMAYCERNVALYTTVLVAGLLYALGRRAIQPLPWPVFGLCLAPLLWDGATQLLGWRESTWVLRTVTGVLAGLAAVWFVYPRLDSALQPVAAAPGCSRGAAGRRVSGDLDG
jgi:uncharacterized membrane protein